MQLHAHAAREVLHVPLGLKPETQAQAGEALCIPLLIGSLPKTPHVLHAHGSEEGAGVEHHPDALLELHGVRVIQGISEQAHLPSVGLHQSQDAFQEGGLPGAIGAYEAHDVSWFHDERGIFQREAVVALDEPLRFDQRFHVPFFPALVIHQQIEQFVQLSLRHRCALCFGDERR